MIIFIELLVLYAGLITIQYFKIKKVNRINYSNYQNCLRALGEYDPSLREYMECGK